MALETLSSTELLNFIVYNTISSSNCNESSEPNFLFDTLAKSSDGSGVAGVLEKRGRSGEPESVQMQLNTAVLGRKKRRRRERVCKNKEEAENQRMTHIAVERNRRKMMNEHLAVLRSLMPESYAQRGDQASVVGGAIEFVKELEQHLQTLEAQKFLILQQGSGGGGGESGGATTSTTRFLPSTATSTATTISAATTPFSQFFTYPQYICSLLPPNQCKSNNKDAIADIEVTLIETHANVRILSRKRVKQLSKLVTAFYSMYLTILHLNVSTLEPMVLYSISAKGLI
uniref:BHLH2 n=1 Tax=Gentiana crassa subsp. rigescens TaxID=3097545 RepID=A0A0A7CCJ7_9GENT|nr:bHLH2 [Gentiana rigescens]